MDTFWQSVFEQVTANLITAIFVGTIVYRIVYNSTVFAQNNKQINQNVQTQINNFPQGSATSKNDEQITEDLTRNPIV